MNCKNARNVLAAVFLSVGLLALAGCGSDPEEKLEELAKASFPNSFKKVAYQVDGDFGYFEYTARNDERVPFRGRIYFKLSDTNDDGFRIIDTSAINNQVIKEDVLADFYSAASKSKTYDFEDCVVFTQELLSKLSDIKSDFPSSNSYFKYVLRVEEEYKDYDRRNNLVDDFKKYREQAPDVVAKYFSDYNVDKYLKYYKIKDYIHGIGKNQFIIEMVDTYPGKYAKGIGT